MCFYCLKSHLKSYKKTILDDIEGLGKARKALIYETYENINDLYKADLNELYQLLPKEVAEKLFAEKGEVCDVRRMWKKSLQFSVIYVTIIMISVKHKLKE